MASRTHWPSWCYIFTVLTHIYSDRENAPPPRSSIQWSSRWSIPWGLLCCHVFLLAPHLVTFEKARSAQALSSTEALGLEASEDGVLADIEAIFGNNRKARALSGRSQESILRPLGEFLWSACWLLHPVSFRAPQEVVHGSLAAAKLGFDVSAWPALSMELNEAALFKWKQFWRSSHNFWFVVFVMHSGAQHRCA